MVRVAQTLLALLAVTAVVMLVMTLANRASTADAGMVTQLGISSKAQLANSIAHQFSDYRKYPVAAGRMDLESFETVQPVHRDLLERYVELFPELNSTLRIAMRNDRRLTYSDEILPIIEHALVHRKDTNFGLR